MTEADFGSSPSRDLKMFFTDLYKAPKVTFSKFRHVQAPPPDYGDPDLVSKDKIRQKAAVRKYLDEKIRGDWEFDWPPRRAAAPSPPPRPEVVAALSLAEAADAEAVPEEGSQDDSTPKAAGDGPGTPQSHPDAATGLASPPPDAVANADPEVDSAAHMDGVPDAAPASDTPQQDARAGPYDNAIDDGNESDDDDDGNSSDYSVFSEDEFHFRPRLEWESEISDDDSDDDGASATSCHFRFESPDTVGETIRAEALSKKEKRRRAAREEAGWNDGVACFEARRDAWTGAKTVRLKKKPASPTSGLASLSPRRLFFRSSPPTSPLSSSPNDRRSGDSPRTLSDGSDPAGAPLAKSYTKSSTLSAPVASLPIETLIPLAPPLLPPANAMRSSISPSVYPALYDKLVVNGLTPSCPVNLSDMIRACVVGWKRDGEWPPRAAVDPPPPRRRKKKKSVDAGQHAGGGQRRMSLGLLGREGDGGGIRRSVQKFFGHGHVA